MGYIRAGKLRHRITIQTRTKTRTSGGGFTETWSDTASVWASIEPSGGTERQEYAQLQQDVTHKITIRSRTITAQQRIKFGSRIFDIISFRDIDERDRRTEIMCNERQS